MSIMNFAGFGLALITLALCTVMVIGNRLIRKVTNSYFFWLIVGAFCFSWLVAYRFAPDWQNYASYVITDPSSYTDSVIISKAFLLDICPFSALAMSVLLMVDPTRKVARSFAPLALIGGLITVVSLCFDNDITAEWSAQFIFFGLDPNKCYFMMHFMMIMMALGIMLNTPRNGWKGTLLTFIIAVLYYSYVGIIMRVKGVCWNVSGLSLNDWDTGEYSFARKIFGIPLKACPYVGIPVLFLVGCGVIAIKDYVFDRGSFRYGNAFSGYWYHWYNYNKYVKQNIL